MSKLTQQIELMGAMLQPGMASSHSVCPSCLGGQSGEKSFIIIRTQSGRLWYRCHRVSCNFGGVLNFSGSTPSNRQQEAKQYSAWIDYPHFIPLTASEKARELRSYLINTFGLTDKEMSYNGFLFNPKEASLIMPIRSPTGGDMGFVDRSYSGRKPKTITTVFSPGPIIDVPYWGCSFTPSKDEVIVVEDKMSAIIMARFSPVVSLLGSHMTLDQACKLAQICPRIRIMLDGDAVTKALKMKREYSLLFDSIKVTSLQGLPDPKDMTVMQLLSVLGD